MSDTLLSPADLAERLGKSADYWYRKAARREVPHRRLGRTVRFTEEDVAAILDAALVTPTDPLASLTAGSRAHAQRQSRRSA